MKVLVVEQNNKFYLQKVKRSQLNNFLGNYGLVQVIGKATCYVEKIDNDDCNKLFSSYLKYSNAYGKVVVMGCKGTTVKIFKGLKKAQAKQIMKELARIIEKCGRGTEDAK